MNCGFVLRIAIARRILFGVTFDVVIRIGPMPLAENTSASLTLAAQMPIEPPASCRFAMAGHLCDLPCGRLATPIAASPAPHRRDVLLERVEVDAERGRVEIPFRDAGERAVRRLGAHLGGRKAARRPGPGGRATGGHEKAPA